MLPASPFSYSSLKMSSKFLPQSIPPPSEHVLDPYDLCEVFHQGEFFPVLVAFRARRAARPSAQYDDVWAAC